MCWWVVPVSEGGSHNHRPLILPVKFLERVWILMMIHTAVARIFLRYLPAFNYSRRLHHLHVVFLKFSEYELRGFYPKIA